MSERPPEPTLEQIEQRICRIWADVLRVERIDPSDSFLAIGGTSLQGLRLVSRVRAEFDVSLPADLFLFLPTAAAMAGHIQEALHDPEGTG
ncbi:acyl carrier protein [Micromonospora sp. LOL_024]|uniref:acyl carrier protein n=1 Tax=Micromonospora sp. LOL_024 TaxID=3345412 RepID=UPI003A852532